MKTPASSELNEIQHVHQGAPQTLNAVLEKITGLGTEDVALIVKMGGAYLGKYRCKDGTTLVRKKQTVAAYWRWPIVMHAIAFQKQWLVDQNQHVLVANKPQGMPTQGRREADYLSFYEVLKNHLNGYLGLHHRLDQNTSGLMLFSRSKSVNKAIANLFSNKIIEKTYLAVAKTWPFQQSEKMVDAPLGSQRLAFGTRQTVTNQGKPAQTRFRCLEVNGEFALLEAQPITGRTHQVRAHLAHLGIPLHGDGLYGSQNKGPFMLHCSSLQWPAGNGLEKGAYTSQPPHWWRDVLPSALFHICQTWKKQPCLS